MENNHSMLSERPGTRYRRTKFLLKEEVCISYLKDIYLTLSMFHTFSKRFTSINWFNLHINSIRKLLLLLPFTNEENQGTRRKAHLTDVTQLVSGHAGISTLRSWGFRVHSLVC